MGTNPRGRKKNGISRAMPARARMNVRSWPESCTAIAAKNGRVRCAFTTVDCATLPQSRGLLRIRVPAIPPFAGHCVPGTPSLLSPNPLRGRGRPPCLLRRDRLRRGIVVRSEQARLALLGGLHVLLLDVAEAAHAV